MPVVWPAETPLTYSSWKIVWAAADPARAAARIADEAFMIDRKNYRNYLVGKS